MNLSAYRVFFLCLLLFTVCCPIDGKEHIRFAAIVFRHGDRTPVDQYPTDPYRNQSMWPVRFGELTNTGKQQHYALGQWLRSRYRNFISDKFDPFEIYVRSTNVDRTLMSASVNLAGIYPPVGNSVWDPSLHWQPIPIHTLPEEDDEVLAMKKKCPNYDKEYERVKKTPEYRERLQKYDELMKYLSKYVGFEVKDYYDMLSIYSDLKIEQLYHFKLPDWTSTVFPGQLIEPAGYSFTTETATPLMTRLRIGPFLKEVLSNMVKTMFYHNAKLPDSNIKYKDDGKPPLKFCMYSAHDLNIGSILNGLGMYDGKCPEYTSTIFFELVYDDAIQVHFIKILYRNSTEIIEPIVMPIPNCGVYCPLERFLKIYNDIIPDDWEAECYKQYYTDLVLACISGVFICISGFFSYFYFCKRTFGEKRGTYSPARLQLPDITRVKYLENRM